MSFSSAHTPPSAEVIKSAAQKEATSGFLRIDESGLTSGMKMHCIRPAKCALDEWLKVRAEFDAELKPFVSKIDALDALDEDIKNLEEDAHRRARED